MQFTVSLSKSLGIKKLSEMRHLTYAARIITGAVFIFSGFVKGIDPSGTAYKLSDYFTAFRLGFLDDTSMVLSVLLCAVEFITGIMLVTGSFLRLASWAAALFMAVFTPVTLLLALFNPVSDCGCFGDAIHLTNWQTFFKNVILTLIVVFVFIRREDNFRGIGKAQGVIITASAASIFLIFMLYNLAYLPVIDFRPYKPGTNLQESMAIPPDAPTDKYDIRFIYEKDGIQKEFTLSDYPANDTTWKFVDQKSVLTERGYVPLVHDFSLVTDDGNDMTYDILSDQGFTMLMIVRRLEEADEADLKEGFALGEAVQQNGTGFFVVTSTEAEKAHDYTTGFFTLFADETTLKTVIRSNPGYVLLKQGTVMYNWSSAGLPEQNAFSGDLNALVIRAHVRKMNTMIVFAALLSVILVFAFAALLRKTNETKT